MVVMNVIFKKLPFLYWSFFSLFVFVASATTTNSSKMFINTSDSQMIRKINEKSTDDTAVLVKLQSQEISKHPSNDLTYQPIILSQNISLDNTSHPSSIDKKFANSEVIYVSRTNKTSTTPKTLPLTKPIGSWLGATIPEQGKWIIRNNITNTTCIIAEMVMQLNISYPADKNQVRNTTMNIPGNSSIVNSSCSESMQSMNISWGQGHSLQINFGMNETAKDFFVSGLSLNVNATFFPDIEENTKYINYESTQPEFTTPLDMSYKCDKSQQVNLTSSNCNLTALLTFENIQIEAFMNKTKDEFGASQDCEIFDTPDIVPIAVGCALAILVLVVLVAYLIGRKRSQNRGYLSM